MTFLRQFIRTNAWLLAGLGLVCGGPAGAQTDMAGSSLRIGFWKLRQLSGTRDYGDLKQMAGVIHSLDCVALGESYSVVALSSLVNELTILGGRWNMAKNSRGVGHSRSHPERYAILYRSDKLQVKGRPRTLPEPTIRVRGGGRRPFDRQPFLCRFATVDGRLDFSLMVVHITPYLVPGRGNKRPAMEPGAFRLGEIRAVREMYLREQSRAGAPGDLLLMGHFRYPVSHPVFAEIMNIPGMRRAGDAEEATNFRNGGVTDHIFLPMDTLAEFTGKAGVLRFEETIFGGDKAQAVRVCSEHRPVWVELEVPR